MNTQGFVYSAPDRLPNILNIQVAGYQLQRLQHHHSHIPRYGQGGLCFPPNIDLRIAPKPTQPHAHFFPLQDINNVEVQRKQLTIIVFNSVIRCTLATNGDGGETAVLFPSAEGRAHATVTGQGPIMLGFHWVNCGRKNSAQNKRIPGSRN